jgi:hypothetical protein
MDGLDVMHPSAAPFGLASRTGSVDGRYGLYRAWCAAIGVPPASAAEWERINQQVPENCAFDKGMRRKRRGVGPDGGNTEAL